MRRGMGAPLVLLLSSVLFVSVVSGHRATILLVDSSQGAYLNHEQELVAARSSSLPGLLSALGGIISPSSTDEEETSRTVQRLVRPSPLKKPRAHMVFNVAGLSRDALVEVFGGRPVREVELEDAESPEETIMDSLASVAASNPDLGVTMLDYQGLQSCYGNCLEEHLPAAAGCMGAKHSDSALTFQSGASLDLSQLSDKVFAVEAASLYSGLQVQQQQDDEGEDLQMLETTLVGLQALETSYGMDSEVTAAARDALMSMLRWTVARLDAKYAGDITYQVTGFPSNPAKKATVAEIMGWKQESRRRLAQATPAPAPAPVAQSSSSVFPGDSTTQAQYALRFSEKACGYGGFVLLVYFGLAAIWCMCYMPFKQDTMLFGAKKQD